jgi:hypothetical protein
MVILGGSRGIFGIYIVFGRPWCKKIGAYVEIGQITLP